MSRSLLMLKAKVSLVNSLLPAGLLISALGTGAVSLLRIPVILRPAALKALLLNRCLLVLILRLKVLTMPGCRDILTIPAVQAVLQQNRCLRIIRQNK